MEAQHTVRRLNQLCEGSGNGSALSATTSAASGFAAVRMTWPSVVAQMRALKASLPR